MNQLVSEAKRRLSSKIESLSLQIKQREDRKQIFWSSIENTVKNEPITNKTDREIRNILNQLTKLSIEIEQKEEDIESCYEQLYHYIQLFGNRREISK